MKATRLSITNPKYSRAFDWIRLVSITGIAQVLVQGIGLISGILIIRLLPTGEYALYTLANTMLGTMTVLADGGIASGVMSEGGKVWNDRVKLGVVVKTGLELRKRFAVVSMLVSSPILLYLLIHHGASWLFSVLILASLLIAFRAALSDSLLEVAVKLNQDISRLQKNQVYTSVGRLIMITGSLFVFPWTFVALLGNGIPRILGNIRLQKICNEFADKTQHADPGVRKRILANVKQILPGSIYYCISGQITIWLISIFGTTSSIAQIGALGRLTMVLTVFSTLFSTLVIPRFAKIKDTGLLLPRFLQIQFLLLAICVVIVGLVSFFPGVVLSVLGSKYQDLNVEMIMITIGSCISLVSGVTFSLSVSRGWALPSVLNIVGSLATQVVLIVALDLSKITNVLWFSIINSIVTLVMWSSFFLYKLKKFKTMEEGRA